MRNWNNYTLWLQFTTFCMECDVGLFQDAFIEVINETPPCFIGLMSDVQHSVVIDAQHI